MAFRILSTYKIDLQFGDLFPVFKTNSKIPQTTIYKYITN